MEGTAAEAQRATAISSDQETGAKLVDLRIVLTVPEKIRDLGRVKIGDGGTAPRRRPSLGTQSAV